MAKQTSDALHGEIIETHEQLTLVELCRTCGVHAEWVFELIDEGIIEPQGKDVSRWRFSGINVIRLKKAHRLHHDLGVNISGIALALDLLDELETLRRRLRVSEPGASDQE